MKSSQRHGMIPNACLLSSEGAATRCISSVALCVSCMHVLRYRSSVVSCKPLGTQGENVIVPRWVAACFLSTGCWQQCCSNVQAPTVTDCALLNVTLGRDGRTYGGHMDANLDGHVHYNAGFGDCTATTSEKPKHNIPHPQLPPTKTAKARKETISHTSRTALHI